ncbi:hypothetical protein UCRPC4_g05952 [Phaeomoniella chlamydospora]|uniref:Uncharacterized protein n=1 Tax=Phaeomoniella chlamydospora TaxID=158046 RepID=A0A0G2GH30_PHACM|nr:hypothetical protein UCRPC4_g05952 [Phaeomoniella chlamydospora]
MPSPIQQFATFFKPGPSNNASVAQVASSKIAVLGSNMNMVEAEEDWEFVDEFCGSENRGDGNGNFVVVDGVTVDVKATGSDAGEVGSSTEVDRVALRIGDMAVSDKEEVNQSERSSQWTDTDDSGASEVEDEVQHEEDSDEKDWKPSYREADNRCDSPWNDNEKKDEADQKVAFNERGENDWKPSYQDVVCNSPWTDNWEEHGEEYEESDNVWYEEQPWTDDEEFYGQLKSDEEYDEYYVSDGERDWEPACREADDMCYNTWIDNEEEHEGQHETGFNDNYDDMYDDSDWNQDSYREATHICEMCQADDEKNEKVSSVSHEDPVAESGLTSANFSVVYDTSVISKPVTDPYEHEFLWDNVARYRLPSDLIVAMVESGGMDIYLETNAGDDAMYSLLWRYNLPTVREECSTHWVSDVADDEDDKIIPTHWFNDTEDFEEDLHNETDSPSPTCSLASSSSIPTVASEEFAARFEPFTWTDLGDVPYIAEEDFAW